MTTQTQDATPFELAERELAAADAEVGRVEREVAPVLEKFGALHEQLDALIGTRGADHPETRKVTAAIAARSSEVAAARAKVERVQRRRTGVAETFESERRAIAFARQAVIEQEQRRDRQADAVSAVRRLVSEKEVALDHEERELLRLRGELAALTGEESHTHRGEQ